MKKLIQESGRCPKCGSFDVEYTKNHIDGDELFYTLKCAECGTVAREIYTIEYIETEIVED